MQQENNGPGLVTRTRQDLINSGDLFRMNEKFAREEQERELNLKSRLKGKQQASLASFGEETPGSVGGVGGPKTSGRRRGQDRLSECCYSICNVLLIVASVTGLVLLVRFLQDEPLYEYGEYLLGLRFYRQLVFVMILMPLVLLLPTYNALSALLFSFSTFSSSSSSSPAENRQDSKLDDEEEEARESALRSVLKLKLVYTSLMLALVFLALVLVGPYVREASVASQMELEFRRHLQQRYESEFSYQLLDRIQEQYECCDHLWYRANLQDKVPISCFVPGSGYSLVFDTTCPEVLGDIVSTRCGIISLCLVLLLAVLGCLLAIDLSQLMARSGTRAARRRWHRGGEYAISPSQASNGRAPAGGSFKAREPLAMGGEPPANGHLPAGERRVDSPDDDEDLPVEQEPENQVPTRGGGGPALADADGDRERQVPLLAAAGSPTREEQDLNLQAKSQRRSRLLGQNGRAPLAQDEDSPVPPGVELPEPIVLTRADYRTIARERSQSPVFVSRPGSASPISGNANLNSSRPLTPPKPIKSALKRSPSASSSQQNVSFQEEVEEQTFESLQARTESAMSAIGPTDRFRFSRPADGDEEDEESIIHDYKERLRKTDSLIRQKQLERREQLRKSLQSVRFADA